MRRKLITAPLFLSSRVRGAYVNRLSNLCDPDSAAGFKTCSPLAAKSLFELQQLKMLRKNAFL
jgi:hypothetical protein